MSAKSKRTGNNQAPAPESDPVNNSAATRSTPSEFMQLARRIFFNKLTLLKVAVIFVLYRFATQYEFGTVFLRGTQRSTSFSETWTTPAAPLVKALTGH
jgi:hypothetical protein